MPFDVSVLETADSSAIEIVDLRGEPTGFSITLAGPNSEAAREAQRVGEVRVSRFLRRAGSSRKMSQRQEDEYRELLRDVILEKLVACTMGWQDADGDEVVIDGKAYKCTPESVRLLYEKAPGIKDQMIQAMADEGNFTKA